MPSPTQTNPADEITQLRTTLNAYKAIVALGDDTLKEAKDMLVRALEVAKQQGDIVTTQQALIKNLRLKCDQLEVIVADQTKILNSLMLGAK
jgi:hypothetical protein